MATKRTLAVGTALTSIGLFAFGKAMRPYYPDIALQAGLELLSQRRRVLAIGPHPGDLEFFCGGTLSLLSQNDSEVTAVVLTAGERATNLPNIAEIRTREAESSARVLGCQSLVQLDLPDGDLGTGRRLLQSLEQAWRQVQPDVILAFDPKGPLPYGNNRDHLALGAAIMELVRRGLPRGMRVYFYGTRQPNVLVDMTEVLEEKTAAVKAHRSQLRGPDWLARRAVRISSKLGGGTPAMYAEAYYRLV